VARAAPSDDVLHIQFSVLAAINALVAAACFILLLAILKSRNVRSKSFNLYLLFIVIPDFVASFSCFITCALSAPGSSYYSEVMCGWQAWYLAFGFTANCWMNGVIVHQLHKMLRFSHIRRRYTPPTIKYVILQACAVYLYSVCIAFLGVWNIRWLPLKTSANKGFACFPMEYDLGSTLFYWLVFVPAVLMLPALYAMWVAFDVWRKKMLPPMGRRRNLVIYFSRLIVVYLFMWLPFLVVCTVGNSTSVSSWVYWSGAAWSHVQGMVSSLLSMTKPDIKTAVADLLCCRQEEEQSVGNIISATRSEESSRMRVSTVFSSLVKSALSFRLAGTGDLSEDIVADDITPFNEAGTMTKSSGEVISEAMEFSNHVEVDTEDPQERMGIDADVEEREWTEKD
jgi:hypothetical protein